jgi:membrane protease YdiL (CAAX protease family)
MVATKIGTLIVYAIMAWVAISFPLTLWSQFCIGLLVIIVLAHIAECFMYRKLMQQAPGTVPWHLANVFLFGVMHKVVMTEAVEDLGQEPL